MALWKRSNLYWADFSVDGTRYRVPLETSDWREAQSRQTDKIAEARDGRLAAGVEFAKLPFNEAVERWLTDRAPTIRPKTLRTERERSKPVKAFFGGKRVSRVTLDDLIAYRTQRTGKIGPASFNRELDVIRGVLKRAKCWRKFEDDFRPLPKPESIGRALEPDQKKRLLTLAASRPEWTVAYNAALLALNTTMRGCEVRGLRWRDVNWLEKTVTVVQSKTRAGERVIPLNGDAMRVVHRMRERALKLFGAAQPDSFVFSTEKDATVPLKGWRSAWRTLTRTIDCPACKRQQNPGLTCDNEKCHADICNVRSPLAGLRFHDLRHHSITELAEKQHSDETIMSVAGHVSRQMLSHYSHIRLDAKRRAVETLEGTVN